MLKTFGAALLLAPPRLAITGTPARCRRCELTNGEKVTAIDPNQNSKSGGPYLRRTA